MLHLADASPLLQSIDLNGSYWTASGGLATVTSRLREIFLDGDVFSDLMSLDVGRVPVTLPETKDTDLIPSFASRGIAISYSRWSAEDGRWSDVQQRLWGWDSLE